MAKQKLDFDVSGFNQLKSVNEALENMGKRVTSLNKATARYNESGKLNQVVFQGINKAGNSVSSAYEKVDGVLKEVERSVKSVNAAGQKQIDIFERTAKGMQRTFISLKDLTAAEKEQARVVAKNRRALTSLSIRHGTPIDNISNLTDQQVENELKTQRLIANVKEAARRKEDAALTAAAERQREIRKQIAIIDIQTTNEAAAHEFKILAERAAAQEAAAAKEIANIQKVAAQRRLKSVQDRDRRFLGKAGISTKGLSDEQIAQEARVAREVLKTALATEKAREKIEKDATKEQKTQVRLRLLAIKRYYAAYGDDAMRHLERLRGLNSQQLLNELKTLRTVEKAHDAAFLKRMRQRIEARQQVEKQQEKIRNSHKQTTNEIVLNFKQMLRVLKFSILHRAFFTLIFTLRQATQEAIQFGIQIAEIRTIANRTASTFGEWTEVVRNLSLEFGNPLLDTAEGVYQAISNQILHTTQNTQFLTEAMRLSITTVASFSDAVAASSAVLNAFNLGQEHASRVNAILFKTVELGRVRLSEMANTLGRVSVLSDQLSVSIMEQHAALATLTIQGVKFNVAQTFLVNIFNKMIRPSDRMKEIYEEWGVSSGQAAIAAFGLGGVMQRLFDIAKNSGDELEELGEIFQRIRATSGAAAFDIKKFDKNLKGMSNSARDAADAFDEVKESAGKRLQVEFEKLKTFFITDFGSRIADSLGKIAKLFGGLVPLMIQVTKAVGLITAAWLAYRVALLAVTVQQVILSGVIASGVGITWSFTAAATAAGIAIKSMSVGTAVLTGGLSILGFLLAEGVIRWLNWGNTIEAATQKAEAQFKMLNKEKFTNLRTNIDEVTNKFEEFTTKASQSYFRFIANLTRNNTRFVTRISNEYQALSKNVVTFFDRIVERSKSKLKAFVSSARSGLEDIASGRLFSRFESEFSFLDTVEAKVKALSTAEGQVRKQGNIDLGGGDLKKAQAAFRKSDEFAQRIIQLKQREREENLAIAKDETKGHDERTKAAQRVLVITQEIRNTHDQIDKIAKNRIARLEAFATAEEAKENAKRAREKAAAERVKRLKESFQKLADLEIKGGGKAGEARALEANIRKQLSGGGLDINVAEQAQLINAVAQLRVKAEQAAEAKILQNRTEQAKKFATAAIARQKKLNEDLAAIRKSAGDATITNVENFNKTLGELGGLAGGVGARHFSGATDLEDKIKKLRTLNQEFADTKSTEVLKERNKLFQEFIVRLREFQDTQRRIGQNSFGIWQPAAEAPRTKNDDIIIKRGNELLEQKATTLSTVSAKQNQLNIELDKQLKAEREVAGILAMQEKVVANLTITHEDAAKSGVSATQRLNEGYSSVNRQLFQVEKHLREIQRLQNNLTLPGAAGAVPKAKGGPVGTDTRHVIMDPKEFIVNARASEQFAPLLSAINSFRPEHQASGSITTVGDINLTVQGADNPELTGQQIAQVLQREIRLGRARI